MVELSNPNNNYSGKTLVKTATLQFDSPGSIGGNGADVEISAGAIAAVGYPIDQSLVARIAPVSVGTIALVVDSSNDLDLATAGLDQVVLAARGFRVFSGRIIAANGSYRFGGLNGILVLMAENALSGVASLQVDFNEPQAGTLLLNNSNALNGDAVVHNGILQIGFATFTCDQLEAKAQAKVHLGNSILNADVLIDPAGLLDGCGVINGPLTNNGTVSIDCFSGLQLSGPTINNGTMRILSANLSIAGPFTNNGVLDLLTSPDTVLPPQVINNGTIVYPGDSKVRSISKRGSTFTISVRSFTGHNYQLQRSLALTNPNWQNIDYPRSGATGFEVSLSDTGATTTAAFYRIQISP